MKIRQWWKKLKKIQINGKIAYVHGSEVLILLKCPKAIWKFNAVQNPKGIFMKIEKSILKHTEPQIKSKAGEIVKENGKVGVITLPGS